MFDSEISSITSSEFFADALLHESIRVSGTPYRLSNSNGISQAVADNGSDILSVYNTM
ncbi:MAG: hypothetical protein ACM3NT_03360 [Methylocystaceae bacterium]